MAYTKDTLPASYTVKKGDTLSKIATTYNLQSIYKVSSNAAAYKKLAKINNISNANLIHVGQKLKFLSSGTGGVTVTKSTKSTKTSIGTALSAADVVKCKITGPCLQNNSGTTLYATWKCTTSHIDHYEYKWQYNTGNGVWFNGSSSTTTDKQSTYSIPSNATSVRFQVKPVSSTYTDSKTKKTKSYWSGTWMISSEYLITMPKLSTEYCRVTGIGEQNDSDGTLFATWNCSTSSNVDHYEYKWYYGTGNGVWFTGTTSTTTDKNCTYSLPSNAKRAKFIVKPVAKTYSLNGKDVSYWNSKWSDAKVYDIEEIESNTKAKKTSPQSCSVTAFGVMSTSESTLYATWTCSASNIDNYEYKWEYGTGDGVWFAGSSSTTTNKQSTYSIPSAAKRVRFMVKPVSKTHTVNKKEVSYWTGKWSDAKTYTVETPPVQPSSPSVEVSGTKLTVKLEELEKSELYATHIEFVVFQDKDKSGLFKTQFKRAVCKISDTKIATFSCNLTIGYKYRVGAYSVTVNKSGKVDDRSDISDLSEEVGTIPTAPSKITTIRADGKEGIVYLEWEKATNQDSYEIQYATQKNLLESSDAATSVSDITTNYYRKTGLESGETYWFRVRAVNSLGKSKWTEAVSVIVGTTPTAPTTWSSTTTAVTGDSVVLYWTHNCEDSSSQTHADLIIEINGTKQSVDADAIAKASSYILSTAKLTDGATIKWRVRTAGITENYGPYSTTRTITVYAPPTITVGLKDSSDDDISTVEEFPFYISCDAGPDNQKPISYHLSITSDETYETVDAIGNEKKVAKGEEVYSENFDTSSQLNVKMHPGNIDLESGVSYTITASVTMSSGLIAENTATFDTSWSENEHYVNADLSLDEDKLAAYIKPYCKQLLMVYYSVEYDEETGIYTETETEIDDDDIDGVEVDNVYTDKGHQVYSYIDDDFNENYFCYYNYGEDNLVDDVTLSVYRREFDGNYVELATDINNTDNTWVVDPHPSLDYVKYRIVATDNATGAVSFYDMPGYVLGEKAVVIQWDEDWSEFNSTNPDEITDPSWVGSMLKLPYNIDVSDNHAPDVELIEYIGRKHPVSYYGTQTGETASWSVEIAKDDLTTLSAIRRLAVYMGDVYVREPSGSGYWANISVSFSQTHCEKTIPITFDISRVEGGV